MFRRKVRARVMVNRRGKEFLKIQMWVTNVVMYQLVLANCHSITAELAIGSIPATPPSVLGAYLRL
jgi:hypothetical protein